MKNKMKKCKKLSVVLIVLALFLPILLTAQDKEPVTVKTFVRAETDAAIKKVYGVTGGFGKLFHHRNLIPIDKQPVIRMNRDVLYSSVVLDLSKPVTITMPESNGRYQSLHIINQDGYSYAKVKPGKYKFTQEEIGTKYAYIIIRTFIDSRDPKDIALANKLQDAITVEGGGNGPLDLPNWNMEQLKIAGDALNTLAKLGLSNVGAFGTRDEVDPITHLVMSKSGWGGLPTKNTIGLLGTVDNNDGTPYSVTVKDVPVDAFWSIIVYNADGFIPENELKSYSYNNVTSKPNKDGSITINFGGCEDGRVNCIPVSEGWNYLIRMYEPRQEALDGTWEFPEIKEVK